MSEPLGSDLCPKLGLYRIYWKSGGASLAAVGQMANGDRWFAPVNWTSSDNVMMASTAWRLVQSVELIEAHSAPEFKVDQRVRTVDNTIDGVVAAVWPEHGEATVRCDRNMTHVAGQHFTHLTVKMADLMLV